MKFITLTTGTAFENIYIGLSQNQHKDKTNSLESSDLLFILFIQPFEHLYQKVF